MSRKWRKLNSGCPDLGTTMNSINPTGMPESEEVTKHKVHSVGVLSSVMENIVLVEC